MLDVANYQIGFELVKPPQIPITGQSLARTKWTYAERAFIGADLYRGDKSLSGPTQVQAALLVDCKLSALRWALKREVFREAIIAGEVPLVPTAPPKSVPAVIHNVSDEQLVELARMAGADRWLTAALAAGL
jgi:hypothetical protein